MNDGGIEELVRRLRCTPDDAQPLKHYGDKIGADGLTCSLCGGKLAIHYKPHRDHSDGDYWIAMAWCNGGHSNIDSIAEAVGMRRCAVHEGNEQLRAKYRPLGKPRFRVNDSDVTGWCDALMNDPALLSYVVSRRMVRLDLVREHRVGHDGERYTLPVYEDTANWTALIGVRRYRPNPSEGDDKMLSSPGSRAGLFPDVPTGDNVVLCEGEWDTLAARSIGLDALTNTAGATTWWPQWSESLAGRSVWICYDRDAAGVAGAKKVAGSLHGVGCTVRVVRLPLPYRRTHGPDVSDFIRAGGNLRALLNETYLRDTRKDPRPKPRISSDNAPRQLPQTSEVAHD